MTKIKAKPKRVPAAKKTPKTPEEDAKEQSKAELAEERKAYRKRKKEIMVREAVNYDKVAIFRSTKGYWTVVDHSAIILALYLAKSTDLHINLIRDGDFKVKSKLGVVSIKNIDKYKERLLATGLVDLTYDEGDYVIFQLKKALTKTEFDLLAKDEENKRKFLHGEIAKTNPMPTSQCRLRELTQAYFLFYKKHNQVKEARPYLRAVSDDLFAADFELLKICRQTVDVETGVARIIEKLDDAEVRLTILSDVELIPVAKATVFYSRIVDILHSLQNESDRIINRKDPRDKGKS